MNRTTLYCGLCLGALLGLGPRAAQGGVLAYYPFDGDLSDASGNGNHLVVGEGAPAVTTASGEFVFGGGALDADSTVNDRHYLSLTTPIEFAEDDAWSVSFWGRRRAGADIRQGMVLGDTSDIQDFIWIPDNPSQVQGMRFRNSAGTSYDYGVFPDDGQWHHWALVADGGGNLTVYRDNVSQGTRSAVTTFTINSLAHAYNTTIHSMNGQLDEIVIYDEALDAAAVERLFLGLGEAKLPLRVERSGDGSGLLFSWPGTDGKIYDLRSVTDPSAIGDPAQWPVHDGHEAIAAVLPETSLSIALPADATRFFVVTESDPPPVTLFYDDFEGATEGWTNGSEGDGGTDWEHGTVSDVGPAAAASGDNCFATNRSADYAPNANVWLRSPVIDLTSADAATLSFMQFVDIEPSFDYGAVRVLDAADDSPLGIVDEVIDGFADDLEWDAATYALPEAALGKMIKLEFRLISDVEFEYAGWYIDDVRVTTP